jgi:hypothetical protein
MLLAGCTAAQAPPDSDNRTADASGIVVSAQADRTRAALDETIRFTLSVTYPPHVELRLPEIGSEIAGLRIVDFGETGPDPIDSLLVFKKWCDLRADLAGTYIIPPLTVRAVDRGETREITTPQIFIRVGQDTARADNETMQDIIDIKPPVALPRDLRPFILGGVAAFALLVAGLGAWRYVRRRRNAHPAAPKPAHVLAWEQLEQLERAGLVEAGLVHEYYVRLSDIFRHYLQNRFAIPAVEQTAQELLRAVKTLPGMSVGCKNSTRDFLLHADLVKFAKYLPEHAAVQHSHQQVRDIIDQTREDLQSVEPQSPGAGTHGGAGQ